MNISWHGLKKHLVIIINISGYKEIIIRFSFPGIFTTHVVLHFVMLSTTWALFSEFTIRIYLWGGGPCQLLHCTCHVLGFFWQIMFPLSLCYCIILLSSGPDSIKTKGTIHKWNSSTENLLELKWLLSIGHTENQWLFHVFIRSSRQPLL